MKYSSKKPLLIALAIPVLFVTMVATVLIISRIYSDPPTYSFLYTLGNEWTASFEYRVIAGKVQKVARNNCPQQCSHTSTEPLLYLYDTKANQSRQLTMEETSALKLDPSQQSPDGYRVVRGNNGSRGLILSISTSYDYSAANMYLSGAGGQFPINMAVSGSSLGYSYGYGNSSFIGWVIP